MDTRASETSGRPLAGRDGALARQIIGYWTRLAGSGNPNRPSDFQSLVSEIGTDRAFWPRYTVQQPLELTLKVHPTLLADFAERHQWAFWKSIGSPEIIFGSVP